MKYFLLFLIGLSCQLLCQGQKKKFELRHEWRMLEFAYKSAEERQKAIDAGSFIPGNGFPIDTDVQYYADGKHRDFITIPRFSLGIPATLATISNSTHNNNKQLVPYPDWHWHQNSETCRRERLVCVFRVQIDECNRLWVLDSGKIIDKQLCPPQILAFDLNTDKLVHRYEIPVDQIEGTSFLVTPVVDVRNPKNKCTDTFVYAADVSGFGLIVHDVRNKKSWRVVNRYMFPVPEFGKFDIGEDTFYLMDGIFGMALSPYKPNEDRTLYFHSLASINENYVRTSVIRNGTAFHANQEAFPEEFETFLKQRPNQSAAQAMDKNGILYFGLLEDNSLSCWNIETEFNQWNMDTLERNQKDFQFLSGVKIVNGPDGKQELWLLSCRFQKIMTGTMDQEKEVNFRIMSVKLDDILKNSKCKIKNGNSMIYANNPPRKPNRRYGLNDRINK